MNVESEVGIWLPLRGSVRVLLYARQSGDVGASASADDESRRAKQTRPQSSLQRRDSIPSVGLLSKAASGAGNLSTQRKVVQQPFDRTGESEGVVRYENV